MSSNFDEENAALPVWLKYLFWTIITVGVASGAIFLGGKFFKPVANELDYQARTTDPQVVVTIQNQLISDLTNITKKEEELAKLKAENNPVVPSVQASLQAMIDEMIQRAQTIDESKVPPKVLAFIVQQKKQP